MTAAAAAVFSSRSRVVFDGQSLNAAPIGNSYPLKLMNGPYRGIPWRNVPIAGTSWTVLGNTVASRTHPYATKARWAILCMCGGTSDLQAPESNDGPTLYADMASYANGCRTAGYDYIIGTTVTPSTQFLASEETARVAANTAIKGNSGAPFDAVVDFAGDSRLANPADTTYYADGLHWTAAGAQVAADLMSPALATALARAT